MNILFITTDSNQDSELREFAEAMDARAHFSHSTYESIQCLDREHIDTVVLKMARIEDAAILRYINEYHDKVKVLVYASDEFDEAIGILSKGRYEIVRDRKMLNGLRAHLTG
jgi:hypothetical protein